MIGRKAFVGHLLAGLLPAALHAQPATRVARIGVVLPTDRLLPLDEVRLETLRSVLREFGWVDGKNLGIEVRHAGLDPQQQRQSAADLKALPVTLLVASGTITIRAVHEGAPGLPVVMINAGDPIGSGFAASLARPGGLLTGTSAAGEELLAKQLELLASAVPHVRTIHVLMNRANPANDFFFAAMDARARQLGMRIQRIDVSHADELDEAIARASGAAMVVLGDPMFGQQRSRIPQLALAARVPAIFGGRPYVAAGGLMSYLSSDAWHWRSAAGFVDKILRGTKPADIPIEQPTTFELIINRKTAQALGITIPPSLLLRADEVIE